MRGKAKHVLQAALGFAVGGALFYLAVRNVDPSKLWALFAGIQPGSFLPILCLILALYAFFFWLKALRWSWLVRPLAPLRAGEVLPALMIGFMSNNILPAHLGEFVRMYVLAKQHGLSKTAVLSTIVLERIFDFLAIVGVFAVTLQFVPMSERLEIVRTFGYVLGAACVVLFLCFLGYVWRTEWAIGATAKVCNAAIWPARVLLVVAPRRLRERLRPLHERMIALLEKGRDKLLALLRLGVQGLYSLRNPRLLLLTFAVTLFHWSLNGVMLYLTTISFVPDRSLPLLAAFFLLGVCALGVTLPSAPGYVGTTQACFLVALAPFGISDETALAASLYALFLGLGPVTFAGLFFAARLGLKLRTLREEMEEPDAPNGPSSGAPNGASN